MSSVNKAILVGNLGRDPEVRATRDGTKVANLRIATSETYKDRDGNRQERTEWHAVTLWGPLAEIAERYLHKGDKVYIEGQIQTREYEQDGAKRYATSIRARELVMLGGRSEGGSREPSRESRGYGARPAARPGPAPSGPAGPERYDDDDIPF